MSYFHEKDNPTSYSDTTISTKPEKSGKVSSGIVKSIIQLCEPARNFYHYFHNYLVFYWKGNFVL